MQIWHKGELGVGDVWGAWETKNKDTRKVGI